MVIEIDNKHHSNVQLISELILIANFLFLIWHRTFRMPYFRKITASLVILYGITLLLLHFKDVKYYDYVFLGYILLLGILNKNPETYWYKNEYLFISLLAVLIGVMMANRKIRQWVFYVPILAIFGLISYKITTTNSFDLATDFFKMNRNILAMLATTFTILFMVNEKRRRNNISVFFSFVLVAINFYSRSRAGLLVAILIAMGAIYNNYKYRFKEKKDIRLFELIIMGALLAIVIFLFLFLVTNSRFEVDGVLDKSRLSIFKSFFDDLNNSDYIFGFSPSAMGGGPYAHLHNSFLQVFADNGILGIPLILLLVFVFGINLKNNRLYGFFIFLIVIYSLVEFYIFRRWGDLALYPLVIVSLSGDRSKNRA